MTRGHWIGSACRWLAVLVLLIGLASVTVTMLDGPTEVQVAPYQLEPVPTENSFSRRYIERRNENTISAATSTVPDWRQRLVISTSSLLGSVTVALALGALGTITLAVTRRPGPDGGAGVD